ncbi:MAG TPA: DUF2934 domain-containing protein [Geminicoccus sp.]|uniref:DUF2934 domain-containing protein n=1 Tax=Geminicoccus sp. TaxID=2024832 RepID=UPI002E33A77E|nr:DUF2934 domain-containing protein [Geminicoccus sp.]HEX2527898.1 DUF2934 domain-containing protein [Geminicoccus sp.]
MSDDREARIRDRAYHLWVEQGQPSGRDAEHWHEARRLVDEEEQAGIEMLEDHRNQSIAKPKRGTVVADHRPSEEPANKSDEPAPVHAETPSLKKEKKTKTKSKAAPEPPEAEAAEAKVAPRARKGRAKSGSIEAV